MVSTFLVTWPSNKKLILLIKVTVLDPDWSRNQMALFLQLQGHQRKPFLFLIRICSMSEGAKEEKAQNCR
jgi:hypothetical protein